jgi:hypothetical protein
MVVGESGKTKIRPKLGESSLALTDDTLVCRFHVGTCEDERFSTSVRHVGLIVSVRRENARVCREEHFNAFGTVTSSYVQISVGRGKSVMKQTLALVLGIMCFLALTSLVFHPRNRSWNAR